MTFAYASVEEAIVRRGVRMVVVGNVPSPWGEAAKGILHIKGIEWAAVRLAYDSEALQQWVGQRNGPVLIYNDERPRSGWAEILLLAERLAPPLIPAKADERALAFGLAHEICGEGDWAGRAACNLYTPASAMPAAFLNACQNILAKKYGYSPAAGAAAAARVAELLAMLAARLKAQQQTGSRYYIGDSLTAVDVYSATFAAMFDPLPPEVCTMEASTRAAFSARDADIDAALDPILFAHRDMMYAQHLELPLSL